MNFDHIFNAVTGLCEILIWWMIWQDYRIARGKPELGMPTKKWMLMIALSLIPLGTLVLAWETALSVGSNSEPRREIPEFDEPQESIYYSYKSTSFGCSIDVEGDAFWGFRNEYRIAAACIYFDGVHDHLDTPYLQVGEQHDITKGHMPMTVMVNEKIKPALFANGMNFLILLIPKAVATSQIPTLRAARTLGVKIKMAGSYGK